MTTTTPIASMTSPRRAVLIDFDWNDTDLIPALLKQPGLAVRLVAGERTDEAGMRVAEMCGLPRTVDLADLTREIFDVALVSERSPRRTQVEGLLLALGTPSVTPQTYLDGGPLPSHDIPGIEAPLALHAAAFEDALGGEAFSALVEQALPDLTFDAPTTPQPVRASALPALWLRTLEDFPSPEDRHSLESALLQLMNNTGAEAAQIHAGRTDQVQCVAHVGTKDPLLKGLVELALELNQPQVVSRVGGPDSGKVWGAWPFRTTQHRGVIAAAGIKAAGECSPWERMVDDLRHTWGEHDREVSTPALPITPETRPGWLTADGFAQRLELAVDRNRREGTRFALHRLEFPDAPSAFDRMCTELPSQLRDTDSLLQPAPRLVLLLTAGPAASFLHVRRRLLALWEHAWSNAALPPPASPIVDHHIEMLGPEVAEGFLATATGWLRPQ